MKIEECAFYHKDNETCNLLPEKYDNGLNYRFIACQAIITCPYKQFMTGKITKMELNEQINKICNDKL